MFLHACRNALQRGNLDLATSSFRPPLRTREPKILERTVEVAGFARRFDRAGDIPPVAGANGSARAQQLMTSVMIMANKLDELAPNLIRMIESDKASIGDTWAQPHVC